MNPALVLLGVTIVLMIRKAIKYQHTLDRGLQRNSHDPKARLSKAEDKTLRKSFEKDRKS